MEEATITKEQMANVITIIASLRAFYKLEATDYGTGYIAGVTMTLSALGLLDEFKDELEGKKQ